MQTKLRLQAGSNHTASLPVMRKEKSSDMYRFAQTVIMTDR
jgi:hypothetical protein